MLPPFSPSKGGGDNLVTERFDQLLAIVGIGPYVALGLGCCRGSLGSVENRRGVGSGHAEQSLFPNRRSPRSGFQPAYGQPSDAAAPVVAKFDGRANPDDGQRIRD